MASGIPGQITKVKTSVSVDKGLYEALNKYSKASLIPRSRIINKAIEEYLEREYPTYKEDIDK
ncbi:MAG: ribbon-helix-helix domain-containing protein [Leuconostoc pseudomesenteroides]|uniref:ribbon-helix-helix domain-containing protein n=1 Tax=Leuconostoc pseudomesenteroides TaxID=33968 RepID=UPI0039E9A437